MPMPSSHDAHSSRSLIVLLLGALLLAVFLLSQVSTGRASGTKPVAPPVERGVSEASAPRALMTSTGVPVVVVGRDGSQWRVRTPCDNEALVTSGTPIEQATVVVDPGHGGDEIGAVGANGLVEKDLNLAVAQEVREQLEALGETVVLTRTADYRETIAARVALAEAVDAQVLVSIHHNGAPSGESAEPGTEVFYQHDSAPSRRLAGLLYEDVRRSFSTYDGVVWHSNRDAGAKYRLNSEGDDYYGMLRLTRTVPAALMEGLFLSAGPTEAALLARPEVQAAEGGAIAQAVRRFLRAEDAGSGYVTPIPLPDVGSNTGGPQGCVDPPLG